MKSKNIADTEALHRWTPGENDKSVGDGGGGRGGRVGDGGED